MSVSESTDGSREAEEAIDVWGETSRAKTKGKSWLTGV